MFGRSDQSFSDTKADTSKPGTKVGVQHNYFPGNQRGTKMQTDSKETVTIHCPSCALRLTSGIDLGRVRRQATDQQSGNLLYRLGPSSRQKVRVSDASSSKNSVANASHQRLSESCNEKEKRLGAENFRSSSTYW